MVEIYHTSFFQNTTLNFPALEADVVFKSESTPNVDGQARISISQDFLGGNSSVNLTLLLAVSPPDNATRFSKPGPTILLVNKKGSNGTADNDNSGDSSRTKKLGQEVGIPVGLIAFLVIVAALVFFVLRRRKSSGGYLTGKPHVQGASTPGLVGPHRRQPSFHDEPTRGVELQNRSSGGDNWDWGSPGTSPNGRGNAFREEIGRQKAGRGY